MALRMAMLKSTRANMWCRIGLRRWTHVVAQPATPDGIIGHTAVSPPLVLPEFDPNSKNNLELPRFSFGGSMELMAVPKKKVSPHKRGIRNGPKALKPVPVIIRCNGQRGNTGEQSGPAN